MECLQARIDSFRKTKRVKNPNKSNSSSNRKWPHPDTFLANPETLAEAGFYYDPSYDDPDNVMCYYCHKELGGWEEEDNPYLIHWQKRGESCCWARVRCGLVVDLDHHGKFISRDKTRLPTHPSMEEARLETFNVGKGWRHDKTKNSSLHSKSMAHAGFVFTPQSAEDDLVMCLYCQTSLSGWEAGDDPMEEHRKRQARSENPCPFFSISSESPPEKQRTQTKGASKPPSRTTSRSKHQDLVLPTKTEDGDGNEELEVKAVKSGAKTPRKARSASGIRKSSAKTPRAKPRSTSQSSTRTVVNDDDDEMNDEEEAPPPPTVKKTRTTSKSVVKAKALPDDSEETGSEAVRPSRSRTKRDKQTDDGTTTKQSRSSKSSLAVPEEKSGHSRKPSKSKSKPAPVEPEETEAPPTVKAKKTRTASRTKPKPSTEVSDLEPERSTSPRPPPSKQKGKPPSRQIAPEHLFDDDLVADDRVPPPSSPIQEDASHKEISPLVIPKRKKASKPPPQEDETPRPHIEEPKPARPRGRPRKVAPSASHDPAVEEDVFESTENRVPEPAPSKARAKPPSKAKTQPPKRKPTRAVTPPEDVSDEPDETSSDERERRDVSESLTATSPIEEEPAPRHVPKPVDDYSVHEDRPSKRVESNKHTMESDDQMDVVIADPPHPNPPNPSTPPRGPSFQGDVRMEDLPTEEPRHVEPEIIPALSRLPFVPITTLSEAELDMTVEEWIRYQMEVEFDRFRRDGERELQQFRKRAEEVRQVIESL